MNNLAAAGARGNLLCFLNDQVEVIDENWLEKLVARVNLDGVGAAGPMLHYSSDMIHSAGVLLGVGGVADHAYRNVKRGHAGYFWRALLEQDYSCLTAACLLVRRDLFEEVGGFDCVLSAFNDVDLCLRLRCTGARIVWTPATQMYCHPSLSSRSHDSADRAGQFDRDVQVMRARWKDILDNDPCYNPNLSLDHKHQFQLAAPPRTVFGSRDGLVALNRPMISRTCALIER
jgi:O-antigen biosynthesis protein